MGPFQLPAFFLRPIRSPRDRTLSCVPRSSPGPGTQHVLNKCLLHLSKEPLSGTELRRLPRGTVDTFKCLNLPTLETTLSGWH